MAPQGPDPAENRGRVAPRITVSRVPGRDNLYLVHMQRVWRPPTDVYETDEDVVIKVEVAGMREEDFSLLLDQHRLIIAGQRQDPSAKLTYHNMEIRYGEFRSEVRLDWTVDEAAIEARYENGFLFIVLPKAREHRIQIKGMTHEQGG